MNYKGLIFDLDGTLFDSVRDIAAIANRKLKQYGYPSHSLAAYIEFIGNGAQKLIERALPEDTSQADFDRFFNDYLYAYEHDKHQQSRLYPGISELLTKLNEEKVPIAILTNKPHAVTLRTIKDHFSAWKFDIIIGQNDSFPRKPDPTGIHYIAEKLKLPLDDLIFIGDSTVDVLTAQAAGLRVIAIENGYEDTNKLKALKPNYLIKEHCELISILS